MLEECFHSPIEGAIYADLIDRLRGAGAIWPAVVDSASSPPLLTLFWVMVRYSVGCFSVSPTAYHDRPFCEPSAHYHEGRFGRVRPMMSTTPGDHRSQQYDTNAPVVVRKYCPAKVTHDFRVGQGRCGLVFAFHLSTPSGPRTRGPASRPGYGRGC